MSSSKDNYETRYSLIQRLRTTDNEKAWEDFLIHYRPFIFYLLNQMKIQVSEQDDLLQDIMLKLYKNLDTYIEQKGRFRSWLSTVIRNTCLNHFKKKSRQDNKNEEFSENLKAVNSYDSPELEDIIQKEWQKYILNLAMEKLEDVFEENIINCFKMSLEGQSAEHIAETIGIKVNSVYILRNRFKARLVIEMRRLTDELEF